MVSKKNVNEKYIPIVCPICGVGCNTELVLINGKPTKVIVKDRNPDLNGKFICIKGLIVADILNHEDRLKTPLFKNGEHFEKIGWTESLKLASDSLKEIVSKYGSNSIGILTSGKITNEDAYLAKNLHVQS